jgi:DNA-binding SARP family transcriptional activator
MLRVRLAGGLRLESDGRELAPPRSRRARALLAWLALHPGAHARGELAGRFWPDVLDASARTSLRAALTELRAALGPAAEHLAAGRETVALDGEGLWVDAREFEALLAGGRVADAVEVGAGELLSGMDDDWVHEARGAHAARVAEALEQLAVEAERAGDLGEAVRRTRAAVALDPLAEETNRRLIERLAAAGDRASALATYEQLSERLRAALGIAPSAETRALAAEIRRGGHERPAAPAALARAVEAPFAGRAAELERLRRAWGAVSTNRSRRLVLVAGEPGIGKTALALRFAGQVDAAVLVGRCSEEPLSAYEPFAEALHQAGVELERLLGDEPPEAGARRRLFDAVDAVLSDVAPLVLVLDDLQWSDRPTLLLLAFLLRSPRPGPVLAVATYRDTELGRRSALTGVLADLRRAAPLERIGLRGLEPVDVAALARARLGRAEVAGAVHARTGGNAFFVEEVLRGLAEGAGEQVPESVRQAVGGRLARVGEDAEELVAVASALGLEMEVGVLEACAGLEAARAEAALDELVRAHLLRPADRARVEFPHALVREAVYGDLNALRRARLHRRIADALVGLSEERHLEEIAHHLYEAAGPADAQRAVDYLARAAERALAMLAYEEAAEFLSRALEAHGGGPRAGALLVARGEALLRAGEATDARSCFAEAVAIARRSGDDELLARAALGHAGLGVAIIDVDPDRVALLEEALAGVSDPALRAQLLARLAVELYYAPSRDRSETLSAEAVAVARSTGDPRALGGALNARHVALWRPDRLDERLRVADEMIAVAGRAGAPELELQGRNWRVLDLFELGELDDWRGEVVRHGRLAERLKLAEYAWYTQLWHAVDALAAGRFAEARDRAERAREAGRRAGDRNADLFVDMLRFIDGLQRAEYAELDLEFVREKVANSPAGMAYRGSYAWLLAELGHAEEARDQLAIMAADGFAPLPFDANWLSALCECTGACRALGDRDTAVRLYELLAPYAGRPISAGRASAAFGAADRSLGELALLLARADAAVGHFEAAIRREHDMGMAAWAVHSRLGLARALAARGDSARAEPLAAQARAEAAALGLTGLLRGSPEPIA